MEKLEEIKSICNGIQYNRDVPEDAKKLAEENNIIIIVGGSDDLMYCYGADTYLTEYCEHSYGWDGEDLTKIKGNEKLRSEATQLGLKIWWCGSICDENISIDGYDTEKSGAFSYSVDEKINSLDFLVMEDDDVYCTGKIIELPKGFITSI